MDQKISLKNVEKAKQDLLKAENLLKLTEEDKEDIFGKDMMEVYGAKVNQGIKDKYESAKRDYDYLSRRLRSSSFRIPRRKTASRRVTRKTTKSQYSKSRKTTKKASSPKRKTTSPKRRKTTSRK